MRLAKEEDILELASLRIEMSKEDYGIAYNIEDSELYNATVKFFIEHLNKNLFIFIEEIEEKIISTCTLQIMEYIPFADDIGIKHGYICNVYTKPEFRKQGIATKLLEKCLEYCKDLNIENVSLESDNDKARSLYQKLGFVRCEFVMQKRLEVSKKTNEKNEQYE